MWSHLIVESRLTRLWTRCRCWRRLVMKYFEWWFFSECSLWWAVWLVLFERKFFFLLWSLDLIEGFRRHWEKDDDSHDMTLLRLDSWSLFRALSSSVWAEDCSWSCLSFIFSTIDRMPTMPSSLSIDRMFRMNRWLIYILFVYRVLDRIIRGDLLPQTPMWRIERKRASHQIEWRCLSMRAHVS